MLYICELKPQANTMAAMSQILFSIPTVIFALSFKYYVVDFQFKMAGVPHVAIKEPEGEKTGILSSLLSFVMYERSVDFKRTHFNRMSYF